MDKDEARAMIRVVSAISESILMLIVQGGQVQGWLAEQMLGSVIEQYGVGGLYCAIDTWITRALNVAIPAGPPSPGEVHVVRWADPDDYGKPAEDITSAQRLAQFLVSARANQDQETYDDTLLVALGQDKEECGAVVASVLHGCAATIKHAEMYGPQVPRTPGDDAL